MPKQTFYNLPEHKKQVLLEALEKEFSRVPLYEASISNIVKSAEIPRGSFYQYFTDKEDAYFFLLNEQAERSKGTFMAILQKNNGDLFETFTEMFRWTLEQISKGDGLDILKNAFLNMTHKVETTFYTIFNGDSKTQFQEICALINKENLNISTEKDLRFVLQILTTITFHNLIEKLARNTSDEEAIDSFIAEVEILKHGMYKGSNK
ncbi:TetR/AcrR family transcriptional regulator [Salirhabdus sp. Marseille-P4669]|uniref:TetR/AcrR family transcriptional regulator n=1 Tax=Salirhabdus sp. Marseille-P4669 TaxID=2042310 RepID=UPI000C7A17E7|nr:TetR family transcriptional regulator [Salirhabdus sp. Marseille-P4669]